MNDNVSLQKQQYREFHRSLARDGQIVTIQYRMKKPSILNETWQETDGVIWQINNVLMLHQVITPLTFSDGSVASTIISKGDWFCQYQEFDFYGTSKNYFKIIDQAGQVYSIDKVVPFGKYGQGFIRWKFIAK